MHMYIHILLYIVAEAIQMSLMAKSFMTDCMNANKTSSSTPLQLLLSPLSVGQGRLLLLVVSQQHSDGHNCWQPTVETGTIPAATNENLDITSIFTLHTCTAQD